MSKSLFFTAYSKRGWLRVTSAEATFSPKGPPKVIYCILIKSITPLKCSPCPTGIWKAKGSTFSNAWMASAVLWTEEPILSNLLIKHILGVPLFSACRQTLTVWASTPFPPSNIVTAPSSTRRLRVTSPEKSTWPGVSMRLIWHLFQLKLIAADRIVIPLYFYCLR